MAKGSANLRRNFFNSKTPIEPGPVPCFYFARCKGTSALSKQGRSVCRKCADKMQGVEYPLPTPTRNFALITIDRWQMQSHAAPSGERL